MDVMAGGAAPLQVGHTVVDRTATQLPEAEELEHLQLSGTEQKLLRRVVLMLP